MKITLLTCAESVVVDQRTNKVSVFNVIDSINVPLFPFVMQRMTVLSMFSRTPEEPVEPQGFELVIALAGQELLRSGLQMNFSHHPQLRHMFEVQSVVIATPGVLTISVTDPNRLALASWDVLVTNIGAPTAEQLE